MGLFRRNDSPYWWYWVQLDGKVFTGTTNTADRKLAQKIYLEKHHQFVEEHHLPGQRGKRMTFCKMCDLYLERHAKVNKRSWRDDEIIIGKLRAYFGDVPLIQIQPQAIEGYKASRLGHVKEATVNRELTILKGIFSKAVLWGYAYKNPVKEVRLFKEEGVPIKVLSSGERGRLFEASAEFLRPVLLAALETGMRQGEILSLKWKDVDLEQETISVRNTKSRKLREIPLHPELKEALARLPRRSEYIFCYERGRRHSRHGMVRVAFERAKEAAGLADLTFHALRHNFASELISKGADVRTVQEYMGHSSLRMLQRYAHVNRGIWRSTIQLLGRNLAPWEVVR